MSFDTLKWLLPDHPVPTRIWRGPFRGARIVMNPRCSLRKMFGFYEHELNSWLERALGRVTRVLDVGANDGYFTFGCAAAFRRLGVTGEILGFEPQVQHVRELQRSIAAQNPRGVRFRVVQALVGDKAGDGRTTLDAWGCGDTRNTLIKVDVEGAEVEVLSGARSWIDASNLFVIEVHAAAHLLPIQRMFAERGLKLLQVNQRPLPVLGAENRETSNCWLVSDLCE